MKICFVETEPLEQEFFSAHLDGEIIFADCTEEIPADVEILSTFIYTKIDSEFLDAHPQLQLVTTRSSGTDHVDLAECRRRGVKVSYVSSYGENTVAEHTFALILALSRRLRPALEMQKQAHFSFESIRAFDLQGKTLGVIGSGRVGLRVIRTARTFEMEVIANDPQPRPGMAEKFGFRYAPLDELLRASHIITLHCPLSPATHHLLDREAFSKCRPGVLIINTSRGAVIDTAAFNEALDNGIIGAAGLDVLEDERVLQQEHSKIIGQQIFDNLQSRSPHEAHRRNPERVRELQVLMENSRLLARPNVVFTPHAAFNSIEAVECINRITLENITSFLAGKPENLVPGRE